MKTIEKLWPIFKEAWDKFKELSWFLKTTVHLFFTVLFLMVTMKIAKKDEYVFNIMNRLVASTLNLTDDDTTKIVKPEKVVIKIDSSQTSDSLIKEKVEESIAIKKDEKKPIIITPKPDPVKPENTNGFSINDLAEVKIHYLETLGESKADNLFQKMKSFCKNKVEVSSPVSRGNLSQNVIKLPITSQVKRNNAGKKIAKALGLRFDEILHNDAQSTVIQIAHL